VRGSTEGTASQDGYSGGKEVKNAQQWEDVFTRRQHRFAGPSAPKERYCEGSEDFGR
jgi:hypothetical protein